jgi:hypothetical protein
MYMTRHQARSSFKVEIKRATKRAPEVATVSKRAFGNELLERVFGRLAGARSENSGPVEWPDQTAMGHAQVPHIGPRHSDDSTRTGPPQQPPRRVLPDLLSIEMDPVEQRMRQEAAERAARRKAMLEIRRRRNAAASARESNPEGGRVMLPVEVAQSMIAPGPNEVVSEATLVAMAEATVRKTLRKKRKRIAGRSIKKARRSGLPHRFPAGERWKRRLPKACW